MGLGGDVEMKRHGQDDTQNQRAMYLDWIQSGQSPRKVHTKEKRVHAPGISPTGVTPREAKKFQEVP